MQLLMSKRFFTLLMIIFMVDQNKKIISLLDSNIEQ